ncbi:hypothetical protein E2562_022596 [Oryza meyeriana var. granulata]|uniref:Magnesium transporter CorA-like family protein n=1 Tax=Oryza meyeriana var. granulata TaxID=110450 RepID=A0A6G1CTN6_9ORYZ|nr:hypothetical protein E2562_022596 [Oryza meyeriana var. granulata]
MTDVEEQLPHQVSGVSRAQDGVVAKASLGKEHVPGSELWTDGLICAFELIKGHKKHKSWPTIDNMQEKGVPVHMKRHVSRNGHRPAALKPDECIVVENPCQTEFSNDPYVLKDRPVYAREILDHKWVPIGWSRITELVQRVQSDASWESEQVEMTDSEDDYTVADLAAPYWQRPVGPTWWCHVTAGHPSVDAWLNSAHWMHPAIRTALRDESRLISDRMKYLLYEELLSAGGSQTPRSAHEVIAHLVSRLSRWDDRLFRKYIFGEADEIELKFVNRRNQEDLNLVSIILNQEIRRLATQVIRVKWSLHAREEILIELLRHLRGNTTRAILESIRKDTRDMLEEQEAVRGRLFTIQDVMQSTVRAWLQDRSLRITHNLAIFGGGGMVLSIITGLFGINVDGIPGAQNTPYAFGLFAGLLFFVGIVLIGVGILYLGLQNPVTNEKVKVRKLELQQLVSMFQHEAEQHGKVREGLSRHNSSPNSSSASDGGYILIS